MSPVHSTQQTRSGQDGIALFIVLTAVLALSIMIVEFVYSTRVHYRMAANLRDRLQAEYLAKSAVQISLLILRVQKSVDQLQQRVGDQATVISTGPIYKQIPVDTSMLRLIASGAGGIPIDMNDQERKQMNDFLDFPGDFSAQIEDEQGKINVNMLASFQEQAAQSVTGSGGATNPQAGFTPTPTPSQTPQEGKSTVSAITQEQLLALLEDEDYDGLLPERVSREDLIANLVDWVDADTERGGFQGGYEDGIYNRLTPPYGAKNGPFSSLREVALVEGMTPELYDTISSALTVYGSSNRINLNSAPILLLKGFVGNLLQTRNEEEIDRVVEWIDENRTFRNQQEFLQGLETYFGYESQELNSTLLGSLAFQSDIYSIRARGIVGDPTDDGAVSVEIEAVVSYASRGGTQRTDRTSYPSGIRLLYWRMQ